MDVEVRVQTEDFDVGAEYAALCAVGGVRTGAAAMFVGRVRADGDLHDVRGMHLEHYPGMTEKSLRAMVDEAGGRWPLQAVRIVHRVGELAPGAQIVFVGTAGAHRDAAFAACDFLMDYLKTRAPFWKRETDAAGVSRWVEQKASDRERAQHWQDATDRTDPSSRNASAPAKNRS